MQLTIEQQNKIRELRRLLKKNAPYVYDRFAAKKLNDNNITLEDLRNRGAETHQVEQSTIGNTAHD